MQSRKTDFSASESALGYYYQIRYGLLLLLSTDGSDEKSIALETLDDIVVEDLDTLQLVQTKYHIKKVANLTSRSTDFWKTIRVWCESINQNKIDPKSTIFTLITSSNCPEEGLLGKIKKQEDLEGIINELEVIAKETSNQTNLPGYKAFQLLNIDNKRKLIKNIKIIDKSLDFQDIEHEIVKIIRLSTEPKKVSSLLERLEGWWFNECILQLKAEGSADISFKSLRLKINDIQEQLKRDNLPLDFITPIELSDEDLLTYDQEIFVQQLRIIATGAKTLKNAVSDYHRAFKQRAKWIREDLLNPHEEDHYEQRLFDHWKTLFELMEDSLDGKSEQELTGLGKAFYENYYIKNVPPIYIRDRVKEAFVVRGSCHMLSDKKKIGWHPDYKNKF